MKLPQGRLQRRRVVTSLATSLERALETELTGYIRLHSQDVLLLDAEGVGVVTFEQGIPMLAYHTGTDRGGSSALTDIAVAGPYRVERYELDDSVLAVAHDESTFGVKPGAPAEQLAGDTELAQRTRDCVPDDRPGFHDDQSSNCTAVEEFLDDEARITELQDAARLEAETRATDWGFDID